MKAASKVINRDLTDAIGSYYGVLIYWPDLMRVYSKHKTPLLAQLSERVRNRLYNVEGRLHKHRALRELRAWSVPIANMGYRNPGNRAADE